MVQNKDKEVKFSDIAILARFNNILDDLEKLFIINKIPFKTDCKKRYFYAKKEILLAYSFICTLFQ